MTRGMAPSAGTLGWPGLGQGGHHVLVERLAEGARLLGPVEGGDRPGGRRQGGDERVRVEGPVEPDLDQADLLAPRRQRLDDLLHRSGARAHDHHDTLGVGGSDVVEQVVLPPDQAGEPVHRPLHDRRQVEVERS